MNKIVVELHPDDRARLDAIIAGLQNLSAAGPASAEAPAPAAPLPPAMMDAAFNRFQAQEAQTARAQAIAQQAGFPVEGGAHLEPPVEATALAPAPAAPADPAAESVSLAEFQKAITLRCAESAAMKGLVRGLVNEYASSVSAIPAEKRSEFLAKLAAL